MDAPTRLRFGIWFRFSSVAAVANIYACLQSLLFHVCSCQSTNVDRIELLFYIIEAQPSMLWNME